MLCQQRTKETVEIHKSWKEFQKKITQHTAHTEKQLCLLQFYLYTLLFHTMSAPLNQFSKDLYKLLHLPRTATQSEIKQSYRKIALALHPDRHDGCNIKTAEFKEASEAYRILSDYTKRIEYDRWLDGVSLDSDGRIRRKGTSRGV